MQGVMSNMDLNKESYQRQLEMVATHLRRIDSPATFRIEVTKEIIDGEEVVVKVCPAWQVPLDELHEGMDRIETKIEVYSDD